jgi:hypothetical protein
LLDIKSSLAQIHLQTKPPSNFGPPASTPQSWASVASFSAAPPSTSQKSFQASQTSLPIITLKRVGTSAVPSVKDFQNRQKVLRAVPGAVAARELPSGDIQLQLKDTQAVQQARRTAATLEKDLSLRISQKDYAVEVLNFPISLFPDPKDKLAKKTLISQFIDDSRQLFPNLQINNIAWINGPLSLKQRPDGRTPTHASLILFVPSKTLQEDICYKGIVADLSYFQVRFYNPALRTT